MRKVERKQTTFALRLKRNFARSADSGPQVFHALSFEERAKKDREAKMVGNPPHTSLNDHERLRLSHDRSGRSVCGSFFVRHFHIAGSCRPEACREIQDTRSHNPAKRTILTSDTASFRRPAACTAALRKARRKWRHRRERPERVCETAKSFVPAQRATATTPATFRRA